MFEHLTLNGPYSEATAAGFMRELAAALCFLHSNEIIHADLKPENLMLSSWDLGESKLKVGKSMIFCYLSSQIVQRTHVCRQESKPAFCGSELRYWKLRPFVDTLTKRGDSTCIGSKGPKGNVASLMACWPRWC